MRTDAEVRQRLVDVAYKAVGIIGEGVDGTLRDRLRKDNAEKDERETEKELAKIEFSMMNAAREAVSAWAKTAFGETPAEQMTPEERARRLATLMQTPEVQRWLAENYRPVMQLPEKAGG